MITIRISSKCIVIFNASHHELRGFLIPVMIRVKTICIINPPDTSYGAVLTNPATIAFAKTVMATSMMESIATVIAVCAMKGDVGFFFNSLI